jgi:hypothetical protein
MDVSLVSLSAVSVAMIPVVLGLVSVVKMYVDSKWAPLASLALGVAAAFFVPAATIGLTVLQGVLVGLAASGLYSGVKASASLVNKG